VYTYLQPMNITKAFYKDQNGDGRIESAVIDFDKSLPQLPDTLSFQLTGHDGRSANVMARKAAGEITGSAGRVNVSFTSPLTFGLTSLLNSISSGQKYKQDNIPLSAGTFAVEDSVAPVIFSGEVFPHDATHALKRVVLTYSEPVSFPLSSQTAVIFKRDATEVPSGQVHINQIVPQSDRVYEFYVDSTSTFFPIVGDSAAIALTGETKDTPIGNAPLFKLFHVLGGTVPPPEPAKIYVTFPSGTMDPSIVGVLPSQSDKALFIPVLPDGNPMSGEVDGKCGSCFAGQNGVFVGSVIHLEVPGPTDYDFKLFSNLGEFVAQGKGKITENDLSLLEQTQGGSKYHARIVWTGKTQNGNKASIGVYVLVVNLSISKDLKTGAPATHQLKRVLFGFLRSKES